jgi:hypothetical protein
MSLRNGAAPSSRDLNYHLIGQLSIEQPALKFQGELRFPKALPVYGLVAATAAALTPAPVPPESPRAEPRDPFQQYVTLDQCAAVVRRSKRTLDKYRDKMPPAAIEGGGGKASYWLWSDMRPWLQVRYGLTLPATYPGLLG